ncbi:MAG: phosphoribosyl-ATP diphosphatase [Kordiimonadaceae bacterium]|jgi:phosphoribosyl-ATP pyrophosphohydrolase|nr:phosphoribosyl-ATP diphosphatase [Kordiimonadaceae bacterium]MBT6035370.1 phosphoribosyl-ATP diphosphatase [Kordiimonadaceae bacterium]MBT6329515.1 phosphoribosyl-ATP diphosphatase [Kordiimonadaceae bacterium]MBT7583310.1 phosphoribosyl-ATP diphosphatase [Kordiimonadaceae bacterium]
MTDKQDILKVLAGVIESRKGGDTQKSYVASLFSKGRKKIAQKVGEEAVELCIAAAHNDHEEAISESADLLFHMMVLWSDMGIKAEDVYGELAAREGLSGIEEKKARGEFSDGL